MGAYSPEVLTMNRLLAPVPRPRGRHRHALAAAALIVAAAATAAVWMAGCIEKEKVECAGGIVIDGKCYPQCEPDKCLEGNICVDHQCKLVCWSHRDCNHPFQRCEPPGPDQALSGDPVLVAQAGIFGVCTDQGRFWLESTYGTPCPNGNECWGTGCPNGLECDVNACGGNFQACKPDERACAGAEPCNIGKCEGSGEPCVVTTCEFNECTPFVCLSEGAGDTEAYCTHHDCQTDADCPGGFYCGVTRDPHDICGPTCVGGSCSDDGSACGLDLECQKGNNAFCGQTEEPCIEPDQFNTNGKQLFEGSRCLLRRTCLKREPCAPCEHNLDCSLDPEMVCLDLGGQLSCVRFCGSHDDCFGDEACWPSYPTCEYTSTLGCAALGADSPDCPTFPCVNGHCVTIGGQLGAPCASSAECPRQACLERLVCQPRQGSCRGTGGFCDHCIDDTDCGGPETISACIEVNPAGEFACFDASFPDTCPNGSNTECPVAPSGAHGACLNEGEEVYPGDPLYERCDLPYSFARQRYTCWPSPP